MENIFIAFGGAAKALGDGKFKVPMVVFGNPDLTAAKDFFTAETDFKVPEWPAPCTVYYSHGQDATLGFKALAGGALACKMSKDDAGVWVEGQLNIADAYEDKIYKMIEAGKLGGSSGTVYHLMGRKDMADGSHWINHWPLGLDMSLTPKPADPHTRFLSLKDWGDLNKAEQKSYKAELLGEYVEKDMTWAAINIADDALFWNVIWGVINDDTISNDEKKSRIKAAVMEFASLIDEAVDGLLSDEAGEISEGAKDLRALWSDPKEFSGKPLRARGKAISDALKAMPEQWSDFAAKSGAVLSKKNGSSLVKLMQSAQTTATTIQAILEKAGFAYDDQDVQNDLGEKVAVTEETNNAKELDFEIERGRFLLNSQPIFN